MKDTELEDLIKLCQKGNRQAFTRLVKEYNQKIFNLLYRLTPTGLEIEDLAQEVWLKIYQNLNNLKNIKAFNSWLYKIVINTYYDKLRQKGIKVEVSLDEPIQTDKGDEIEISIIDERLLPEEILLEKESQELLEKLIQELPEPYRIAIVMREVNELSYEEIANALNISLGTVKSRIARARERLISGLNSYLNKDK